MLSRVTFLLAKLIIASGISDALAQETAQRMAAQQKEVAHDSVEKENMEASAAEMLAEQVHLV